MERHQTRFQARSPGAPALRALVPFALAVALFTSAALLGSSPAARAGVAVTGIVFQDDDGNGAQDPGELGLPGVRVSNGVDVIETGPAGEFALDVALEDSRFVLLTVPRGFRPTTGAWHRVADAPADSAAFGLAPDPAADSDRVRFVHASDPHVYDATTAAELESALEEIAALDDPVEFVAITGDLVNSGSTEDQLTHVAGVLADPPLTVHAGFGDHDANADSLLVEHFENLIGPSYYSFDRGPYHFILYNNCFSASLDGTFKQAIWLSNDAAAAAADGQTLLIFTHFQPGRQEIDLYQSLGVAVVLSGHWHSNRAGVVEGITSLNTGTLRMGAIDRTSRGFRVIDLDQGALATTRRTGGVAPRVTIVDPPAGGVLPFGAVPIRVMAYATSFTDLAARFRVDGPAGEVAAGDLTAAGGWMMSGSFEATEADSTAYTLTVDLLAGAGGPVLATEGRAFTLAHVVVPAGQAGAPWSRFRGDAGGSGAFAGELRLPLRLAWARHVGGATELGSPVVVEGRVFIAHDAEGDVGSGALVAFDLESGAELWRHPTGAEVKGTPAVGVGRVVVSTSDGRVDAVDAATGDLLWSRQHGDPAARVDMSSPAIVDGVVYVGGPEVAAALDEATGAVLWERDLGDDWLSTIYSAPVCDAERVAFGLYSGLHVLDRATGATVWERAAGARETHRSPAIVDGVLYAAGDNFGSQRLRAFDAATGAVLWEAPQPVSSSNSAPAVSASAVVVGSGYGTVEAFAREDGASLWSFGVGAPIASSRPYATDIATVTSSPLVAGPHALFGADDGRFYAVDVESGAAVWSLDLGAPVRSSPVASGTFVLVATADGVLFAFASGDLESAGVGEAPGGAPGLRTAIGAVWPNPFRSGGTIAFAVNGGGDGRGSGAAAPVGARLEVYDVSGRRVRTLVEGALVPGRHEAEWNARDAAGREVPSGIYFLRLAADGVVARSRLAVLR